MRKGDLFMVRKLSLTEADSNKIPKIKKINVDCINAYELVVRDLLKMKSIYNSGDEAIYAGKLSGGELVIIFISSGTKYGPVVYIWPANTDPDAIDDIITICSGGRFDEEIPSFIDDCNAKEYSFWEFVQEQLY